MRRKLVPYKPSKDYKLVDKKGKIRWGAYGTLMVNGEAP